MPEETLLDKILQSGDIAGPMGEDVIRSAESSLGVVFPPSYRDFLRRFGAVGLRGCEFAGLFVHPEESQTPLWIDVVKQTLKLRRASRGAIPDEYVFISTDGTDYNFYLATDRCDARGECTVVALGPGVDEVEVAPSFNDFVLRTVNGMLSY